MSSSSLDRRRSTIAIVAVVLLAAVAIAGCGSSSPATTSSSTAASTSTSANAPSGASEALKLEANKEGQLAYSTKSLTAKSGNVSIDFTNEAPIGHNVTIESSAGKTVGSTPTFQGGSKTLSLHLAPGTYKFFCSVPGHRMAGMEGTLVVK
jgi:plastocyanin